LQKIVDPSKYFQPGVELASICWFEASKMYTDETPPGLLISYQCGRIQLMKHDKDEQPILIDTMMAIS
jgi:WD repeat-containing protein 35